MKTPLILPGERVERARLARNFQLATLGIMLTVIMVGLVLFYLGQLFLAGVVNGFGFRWGLERHKRRQ